MSEGGGADAAGGELVSELVDRMAHQIRNPMQAIAVNLEVVRTRVRREAPELWDELERFAAAADENVRLLSRRLDLLLAAGRRRPGEEPTVMAPVRLLGDLVAALRFDRDPPAVAVEPDGGAADAGVRSPPGALVALLFRLLAAARSAAAEDELAVRVRREGSDVVVEAPLPPEPEGDAAPGWLALAGEAGGRASLEGEGDARLVRVVLPGA